MATLVPIRRSLLTDSSDRVRSVSLIRRDRWAEIPTCTPRGPQASTTPPLPLDRSYRHKDTDERAAVGTFMGRSKLLNQSPSDLRQ